MAGFYKTRRNRWMRPLYGLKNRLDDLELEARARLSGAITHVHGPAEVPSRDDELVVLCLVRNGALWVESFIRHHLELGVRHLFFLDNGSTDGTVDRLTAHDSVSVWTTDLPFGRFELAFRRWLFRRFGRGRWSLWCDIDELFEYPYAERLSLRDFLGYLNANDYRLVTAHALDMFSDEPFSELDSRPADDLKDKYPFYDLTGIERRRDVFWLDDEKPHHRRLFCAFGGIRKRAFGSEGLLQTRHTLIRFDEEVRVLPYDGHFSTGPVADVTGVLLHYKFLSNLLAYAREAVELEQHSRGSFHYRRFLEVLNADPELSLYSESARRLKETSQLVEEGFLTVSEDYLRWVEAHAEEPVSLAVSRPPGGTRR